MAQIIVDVTYCRECPHSHTDFDDYNVVICGQLPARFPINQQVPENCPKQYEAPPVTKDTNAELDEAWEKVTSVPAEVFAQAIEYINDKYKPVYDVAELFAMGNKVTVALVEAYAEGHQARQTE